MTTQGPFGEAFKEISLKDACHSYEAVLNTLKFLHLQRLVADVDKFGL